MRRGTDVLQSGSGILGDSAASVGTWAAPPRQDLAAELSGVLAISGPALLISVYD